MLPYWFLFLVPAFAALNERVAPVARRESTFAWIVIWSIMTSMIGLRYHVGGDWNNYIRNFDELHSISLSGVLIHSDPGYTFITWLGTKINYGIIFVNIICGIIFSWGLVSFARQQPLPWLAILIAVPYLVIVVAMGYSRQAVAIGFVMLALVNLGKNLTLRFAVYIALAALFHKTALLLIPLAVLAKQKNRIWTTIWIGAFGALLYIFFLADSVDAYIQNYVEAGYDSQGAAIRIAMNAVPAGLFLLYRRHFSLEGARLKLWTYISLVAFGFVILFFVVPSSAALDRMALYFIPVQIFVLSRLPVALHHRYGNGPLIKLGVVVYSALVLFVWLNFAVHSRYWVPYQMFPFAG